MKKKYEKVLMRCDIKYRYEKLHSFWIFDKERAHVQGSRHGGGLGGMENKGLLHHSHLSLVCFLCSMCTIHPLMVSQCKSHHIAACTRFRTVLTSKAIYSSPNSTTWESLAQKLLKTYHRMLVSTVRPLCWFAQGYFGFKYLFG